MSGTPVESDEHAVTRRSALKLLAANIALISSGCGKPMEEILPYVRMPERVLPGIPLEFASTLPLGGYGRGVVCTSVEGRPIKVSGNPLHPASLGSTDVFAEAHVLSLYDPDRSQTVRRLGEIVSSVELDTALAEQLSRAKAAQGHGLFLLTGPISSPTLLRQIAVLKQRFPKFAWHVHDPLTDLAAAEGAKLAFGKPVRMVPRLAEAAVIVTLDADPLGPGPMQVLNARGFADRRRVRTGTTSMSRVYALESVPTATGVKADHRVPLSPDAVAQVALAVAIELGAELGKPKLDRGTDKLVAAIVEDLGASKGYAIVLAGPAQAPEVHALAHWINDAIAAPITYLDASTSAGSFDDLLAALDRGEVESLLISGTNPVYDAALDHRFAERLKRVPFALHHGMYRDETAALCMWHVAEPHPLESWGDLRSVDGTPSLVQPLIDPLYDTRSLMRLLAFFADAPDAKDYDIVRATWMAQGGKDFEGWWRKALHDGVIASAAVSPITKGQPKLSLPPRPTASSGLTMVLQTDPTLYDGSFAGNAWLQECPKPLTKEVWGNSLGLASADATRLGLVDGDTVSIAVGERQVAVPIRIGNGIPQGVISLALGGGRTNAGAIGSGVGANAYALRSVQAAWRIDGCTIKKVNGRTSFSIQKQFEISGDRDDIFPSHSFRHLPSVAREDTLKPNLLPTPDTSNAFARWAMVIDNATCIGCNACVVACQVENNVPVVGPQEIANNRDMHWLRIDAYEMEGSDGRLGFEPVPCMHCETAPCEPVCPVGASIHDSEGLNVQVYNRCIGTRFCEANCPYKVRRFNFFGYADGQNYADLDAPVMGAHNNPNVTVRARGVMEKCTYCVQRISGARRQAEKEQRSLREGEVTTACQNACPTKAITFGDLATEDSAVTKLRREPQHFTLLGRLNTLPRTTYLADVRNPNPELEEHRG